MTQGYATKEGTERLASRHKLIFENGLFRPLGDVIVSAIGFGTYLGNHSDRDDAAYESAIEHALTQGCNLIDTAINYRCMRSERNIGKAIKVLLKKKKIKRDEIVVCTKGGFLPFDGAPPANVVAYFQKNYFGKVLKPDDLVANSHSMAPDFISDQIRRSRKNLGLDTIDLYYLHNPETQLKEVPVPQIYKKIELAFKQLEKEVVQGNIRYYGVASWTAFREPNQLSIEECVKIAKKVGGKDHHFKAVQLPFNLAMLEGLANPIQQVGNQKIPAIQAASQLNLSVFCSASILQSKLLGSLPISMRDHFPGQRTDAGRALQFVISTPGVTSALVGMKQLVHVDDNLKVLESPPLSQEQFEKMFSKG